MGLFGKFLNKPIVKDTNPTTWDMWLGAPEAEAETSNNKLSLHDVFEDFLNVIPQLENGKFIILGRKGCGKSAIGEYLQIMMKDEPNIFTTLVDKSKINLEKVTQKGYKPEIEDLHELLFKWVILTQILNMLQQNEKAKEMSEYNHLRNFLKTNRGYVGVDRYQLSEVEITKGFQVKIEYLRRFFSAFGKSFDFKGNHAEFYKLIPDLESCIIDLMKKDSDNNYLLIFDDLDIGYKKNLNNINSLVDLLRAAKYFNLDLFGKNNLQSRVIILLRDDIAKHMEYQPDTAKIFASYSMALKWYQDSSKENEDKNLLKQFITKRIENNFIRLGIPYDKKNVWDCFVDPKDFDSDKTSFKYVIDYTFYRPRDLLLFFLKIGEQEIPLPISKSNIKKLSGPYANEMIREVKGELSSEFTNNDINGALTVLSKHNNKRPFSYETFLDELNDIGVKKAEELAERLFDCSLIGNFNDPDVRFKCRENEGLLYELDKSQSLILHYVMRSYFYKNH